MIKIFSILVIFLTSAVAFSVENMSEKEIKKTASKEVFFEAVKKCDIKLSNHLNSYLSDYDIDNPANEDYCKKNDDCIRMKFISAEHFFYLDSSIYIIHRQFDNFKAGAKSPYKSRKRSTQVGLARYLTDEHDWLTLTGAVYHPSELWMIYDNPLYGLRKAYLELKTHLFCDLAAKGPVSYYDISYAMNMSKP